MKIKWICFYHKVIKPILYGLIAAIATVVTILILFYGVGMVIGYLYPSSFSTGSVPYTQASYSSFSFIPFVLLFLIFGGVMLISTFVAWVSERSKPCIINYNEKGVIENILSGISAIFLVLNTCMSYVFLIIGILIGLLTIIGIIVTINSMLYNNIIGLIMMGAFSLFCLYCAYCSSPSNLKEIVKEDDVNEKK